MSEQKVLRFHVSDKVFHGVNAIAWFALLITGGVVYFGPQLGLAKHTGEELMLWHLWLGGLFTVNLVGFLMFAPERFAVMMKNLMEWDANTIGWFRNFGGYPRKFFKIPFGPVETPPQGRYNGGQKMSYLIFIASMFVFAITGWLLWLFAPAIGKTAFVWMFYIHVWGSFVVSAMVIGAHLPLAMLSSEHLKGMWRFGPGTISLHAAEHHSPLWLERDVVKAGDKK